MDTASGTQFFCCVNQSEKKLVWYKNKYKWKYISSDKTDQGVIIIITPWTDIVYKLIKTISNYYHCKLNIMCSQWQIGKEWQVVKVC